MREHKNKSDDSAFNDQSDGRNENEQKTGDAMNVVRFTNNGLVRIQSEGVVEKAFECLEGHPHFRGLRLNIQIRYEEPVLMLEGQLPSFFLKQILQTVLRDLDGVSEIQNDVEVDEPSDPSSRFDSPSQRGANDVENEN